MKPDYFPNMLNNPSSEPNRGDSINFSTELFENIVNFQEYCKRNFLQSDAFVSFN